MLKIINFLIFISLIVNAEAFEDQYFTVDEENAIIAILSKQEISRIVFSDHIINVHSIKGEIEYDIQGSELYVRSSSTKPINFFVTTEKDTYKFIVSVENTPATQIFVNKTEHREIKQLNYKDQITEDIKSKISQIIEIALSSRKYLGYSVTEIDKNISSSIKQLNLHLDKIFTGDKIKAERIYITNKSKNVHNLRLSDFASDSYQAVYLSQNVLLPNEKCLLIRVIEN